MSSFSSPLQQRDVRVYSGMLHVEDKRCAVAPAINGRCREHWAREVYGVQVVDNIAPSRREGTVKI